MSRLSLLNKGTFACALIASACLMNSAQAQMGGKSALPSRSTVVAGAAGETIPTTHKKYVGHIEAIQEVDSIARVNGKLTVAPGFEEGMHVTKGQLLFTIDPVPYQAKVDAAKAAIQQLEAKIDYSKKNYDRLNGLYERNAGSQNDKESAESTLLSQQAELLSAKAQLVLAEEDLSYTKIVAELDGRAGRRAYSTGSYVSSTSDPLLKVVQTDPIYIRFTMSERDYLSMFKNFDDLKNNTELEVTLPDDSTYPIKGEISFIDNTVKSTTDTLKVWATFKNPQEILNPGGVVTVNLYKHDEASAASVKPSAVMFDGEKNYVYILVKSIDDAELYKEIKADSRFTNTVTLMEDAVNAAIAGSPAISEFLEKNKDNMIVAQVAESISKALESQNPDAAAVEMVKLATSLGKMKTFGDVELAKDPQKALEQLKAQGAQAWTTAYLDAFKAERYVYVDPKTNQPQNDFAENKVNEKYMMVLRRDVELGPTFGGVETITSGVKPNEIVMMDGVHKARPFDLIVPVYRDEQKKENAADNDAEQTAQKPIQSGSQEAKRVDAKKKLASNARVAGEDAV